MIGKTPWHLLSGLNRAQGPDVGFLWIARRFTENHVALDEI